jgi:hypothetical protein
MADRSRPYFEIVEIKKLGRATQGTLPAPMLHRPNMGTMREQERLLSISGKVLEFTQVFVSHGIMIQLLTIIA